MLPGLNEHQNHNKTISVWLQNAFRWWMAKTWKDSSDFFAFDPINCWFPVVVNAQETSALGRCKNLFPQPFGKCFHLRMCCKTIELPETERSCRSSVLQAAWARKALNSSSHYPKQDSTNAIRNPNEDRAFLRAWFDRGWRYYHKKKQKADTSAMTLCCTHCTSNVYFPLAKTERGSALQAMT